MEAPFSHPQFQNNQKLTMLQQYQQQQQEQQQLQLQQVQQFQQQQNQTQSPLPQFSQLQLQQPQLGTTPSQPGQPSPLLLQYQQQQLLRQQQQGAQPPVGSVGLGATTAPKPPLAANPPQFAMIKIQENMDNILKYMKDLDGRLTRLESSVGDLLRVYKAQEMKLEEIRSLSKKAVETPVVQPAPSSYYTKPAANNVTQSNYGSPGFVPQPVFNPNHKASAPSQEQSDLALARELQAKFDQEAIKKPASNSVPATTGATSECPVCSKAIPVAQIESHVAEHFDDDAPETDSKSTDSENPGFWGKLFGAKKPAKDAPKETKPSTTPSSSASTNNTAPRSSQASPVVMPPPGQPTTMLAYPNAYYPGVAPAPGFYPSNTALPALYPMQFTTAPMVLPPSNNAPKN